MSDVELSSETTTTAKRGRGRPKKDSVANNGGIDTIKNGTNALKRVRAPKTNDTHSAPKSGPNSGPTNAKRGRGRPKGKSPKAKKSAKKGGSRGRPKKTESVEEEAAPLDEQQSASAEEEDEEED